MVKLLIGKIMAGLRNILKLYGKMIVGSGKDRVYYIWDKETESPKSVSKKVFDKTKV